MAAGTGGGYLGVPLLANTTEAIATVCPGPDACYYLSSGLELLETGTISSENYWILNFWPPGVSIGSALEILIARSGLALPVVAGGISIFAWTLVLSLWHRRLSKLVGQLASILTVFAIALSQPMRGWYLGDGLFYAESMATLFALGALLVLVSQGAANSRRLEPDRRSDVRAGFGAGLLLAGAAYFRSPFEVAGQAFTVFVLIAAGSAMFTRAVRSRSWGAAFSALPPNVLGLAAVAGFHAVTIPWRIVAASRIRPGDFRWSLAGDLGWNQVWMPTPYLEEQGAFWLIEGTRNTPCRIDEERCLEIFQTEMASGNPYFGGARTLTELRNNALDVMLNHPLEWLWIKAEAFPRFWFRVPTSVDRFEFLENGIVLLGLVAVCILGWWRIPRTAYIFYISVLVATMVPMIVFHYEDRYLYSLKTLTIPVIALCLGWRPSGEGTSVPNESSDVVNGLHEEDPDVDLEENETSTADRHALS